MNVRAQICQNVCCSLVEYLSLYDAKDVSNCNFYTRQVLALGINLAFNAAKLSQPRRARPGQARSTCSRAG